MKSLFTVSEAGLPEAAGRARPDVPAAYGDAAADSNGVAEVADTILAAVEAAVAGTTVEAAVAAAGTD